MNVPSRELQFTEGDLLVEAAEQQSILGDDSDSEQEATNDGGPHHDTDRKVALFCFYLITVTPLMLVNSTWACG